jgi:Rod binding domain-containing protein
MTYDLRLATYDSAAASFQLPVTVPARGLVEKHMESRPMTARLAGDGKSDELRERFTQFVGEAFFGQMIKAMRSTVGKPAYFHGGQAEEVFQGQLDQQLAEHLTEASADRFAEPMFAQQFPQFAKQQQADGLEQLAGLRRQ